MQINKGIIIIFITTISLLSQEWINISPFSSNDYGIKGGFISEKEGWIFQSSSEVSSDIYYTNDGGQHWNIIYSLDNSLEFFTTLNMIDNQNGWATKMNSGNFAYYMKTTDGGYNWVDMNNYLPVVTEVAILNFINKDVGFLCTGVDNSTNAAIVYKTIDGGYNWYLTNTPTIYYPYPNTLSYTVNKIFFVDENSGWAACSGAIDIGLTLKTSDGGENWYVGMEPGAADAYDIHFINSNYGGVVGRNSFFSYVKITRDNFNLINYNHDNWVYDKQQFAKTICFQDSTTVWVTGDPGIIYRSNDCGATFVCDQIIDASLRDIKFFNKTGYVFGSNNNALFKYTNKISTTNSNMKVYPNPFNEIATISFEIFNKDYIDLSIYNSMGQKVKNILSKVLDQGSYSILWNGKNDITAVNSGIYFVRLKAGEKITTSKVMLLK